MSLLDQVDPVDDLLVVADDEVDRELTSGLVIPESARQVIETGTILKVGPLAHEEFKPGRRIVFKQHGGVPIGRNDEAKGETLRVISPMDCKCFLNDEAEP